MTVQESTASSYQIRSTPIWLNLIAGLVLLVGLSSPALLVGFIEVNQRADLNGLTAVYKLGVRLTVVALAYVGIDMSMRNMLHLVGVALLSFVPVISWVNIYLAGKGVVRIIKGITW